ncbi:MAG: hypothetical protein OXU22_05490 [Gammaproteobacteria bacterium]|nr:hypothetical protein [Gammaproteobacteria bacterium]
MEANQPIIDVPTLRRDLYLVLGLLLADRAIADAPNMTEWTQVFYDNEVRRLMLWVATAMRHFLGHQAGAFNRARCGEYWADFPNRKREPLTFRRACNAVIHAREILPYKAPWHAPKPSAKRVYTDRMTIRSVNRSRNTCAHLDIIRFVEIANAVIDSFPEEPDHADL